MKALSGTCCPELDVDVKVLQRIGALAELRRDLQYDVVLVDLGKHDGDQALAESVVKGVVDGRSGQAEARGGVAIDDQVFFEGVILFVGGDVPQIGKSLQLGHEPLHPSGQLVRIGGLQAVLKLGAAYAIFHREVLHRLHVQGDSLNRLGLIRKAPDDLRSHRMFVHRGA